MDPERLWLAIGLFGQGMFFMRFAVQWRASERVGRSIIPVAFWFFSIAGALILLAYGVHRQDLVIISGQLAGLIIYGRNLLLITRERRMTGFAAEARTAS